MPPFALLSVTVEETMTMEAWKDVLWTLSKLGIDVRHCGYDPLDHDTMQA